jgi:hypothetical protein
MGAEHDVVVVVVVVVVVEAAVKALDNTELRHSLPDMSTLTAIALSIQWWGLRAMSVHVGWGSSQVASRRAGGGTGN